MGRPRRLSRSLLLGTTLLLLTLPTLPVRAATVGAVQSYMVVYKDGASSRDAAADVQGAGGVVVYNYEQIGVVIAKSNRSDFAANLGSYSGVDSVTATALGATQLKNEEPDANASDTAPAVTAAPGDNLSGLQWDMRQIHAFEAHSVTSGSKAVLVGDIDTGLDYTHPDLAPNVDFANSVSCIGGVPNTSPSAWKDDNGHGTHTAGTIAAARNRIGIVGVAPNVRIAAIKAGDVNGFFFPESVVCAFMWAGSHHFNVTNNSYFADPFYFNCKNDPVQRAIWKAESRAIKSAMQQGVSVVAAEGNFSDDLAHPTRDIQSPDNVPNPIVRTVHNNCVVIPVEIPGVIGVTADGSLGLKSFYSNYGVGVTQVTAPGGDSILQVTAAAPNGRVLSTYPANLISTCRPSRRVFDGAATYCYLQGTSMASPHVTGVVALIESLGITNPGAVQARINNTSDPIPCPTAAQLAQYTPFPSVNNAAPQKCQGGAGYNSWYGHGQVNALAAVS